MLAAGVAFYEVVIAIHVAAVVVAFGVTFAYPLIIAAATRRDPRGMPWFHRMQVILGQRLISPGLLVILLAGIYLASKLHEWSDFFVQWGLGVTVLLGALGGLFFGPNEKKLAELAQRDVDAAGDGEVRWSGEYLALRRRVEIVGIIGPLLVLITVYLMEIRAGA